MLSLNTKRQTKDKKVRLVNLMAIVVIVTVLLSPFQLHRFASAAGTIDGTIYQDDNANGVRDTGEAGVFGATVTAYDSSNTVQGTTTSAIGGTYTLNATGTGPYRIEFTSNNSSLYPGAHGSNSDSSIQFVPDGNSTNIDASFYNPSEYCQSDPHVVTPCYVVGNQTTGAYSSSDTLVSVPQSYGSDRTDGSTVVTDWQVPGTPAHYAVASDIGTTYGVSWDRTRNKLYASAYMKQYTGLGPGGTGAIYEVTINPATSAVTAGPSEFVDLVDDLGLGICADPHGADLNPTPTLLDTVWDSVGKCSLGDLEISDDDSTLYTVDLTNRTVVSIDIDSQTLNNTYPFPVDQTGTCPTPATDIRPFGLGYNDGKLYVGAVCSAESTGLASDLWAYVYTLDEGTGVYTLELDFDLGAQRSAGDQAWFAWDATWAETRADLANPVNGKVVRHPSPILSDIEFYGNDLTLGFRDRNADQLGNQVPDPLGGQNKEATSRGDVLCASWDGSTYSLEDGAQNCGLRTASGGTGDGSEPVEEFYWGDGGNDVYANGHEENPLGGLAQAGAGDLAYSSMNPSTAFGAGIRNAGGISSISNETGEPLRGYILYQGGSGVSFFGKAAGLGDAELICTAAPIEIGNRVWLDADRDGIQDAGEASIAGVTVELVDTDGTTVIATAVTDANGHYYFSSSTGTDTASSKYGLAINTNTSGYRVRIDTTQTALVDYDLTSNESDMTAGGDTRDSDGVASGDYSQVTFDTGLAGSNNHSFDFGFMEVNNRIGNQLFFDVDNDGVFEAGEIGIEGVAVELFVDEDDDGVFEPGTDDGAAVANTLTDVNGRYWFEGLGDEKYFVAIPSTSNTSVTLGAGTVDLSDLYNSTGSSLSTHTSSSYEPTTDANLDNDDDGRDNGNVAIPAGYITMSSQLALQSTTEPTDEALPGGSAGADETEANAQAGSSMPGDSSSNLTVDFGFYGLPDIALAKTVDSDGDATFTSSEIIDKPGFGGNTDPTAFQYRIQVTNEGEVNGTNIDIQDEVPAGVTIDSVASVTAGTVTTVLPITSGTIDWDLGTLTPGTTHTLILNASVSAANETVFIAGFDAAGSSQNVAEVTAMTEDDTDSTVNNAATPFNPASSEDDEDDARVAVAPALGNYVWTDTDGDGIQDGGEDGISGVTVNLYIDDDGTAGPSPGDTLDATVVTSTDGLYLFGDLVASTDYYVEFDHSTVPAGLSPTSVDAGADDALDSDGNVTTGYTGIYNLTAAEVDLTVDMGYTPYFSIGNRVFLDDGNGGGTLNDGTQQPNEAGIPNVTLRLLDGTATPVDDPGIAGVQDYVVTTDTNGYYRFDSLLTGDYIVEVLASSLPTGLVPSTGQTTTNSPDQKDHGADTLVSGYYRSNTVSLDTGSQPTDETDIATGQGAESPHGDANSNLAIDFGYIPVADLTITKNVSPSVYTVGAGTSVTYTLTITNNGPNDVAAMTVVDSAPSGVAFNSWTCTVSTPGTGSLTESCENASGSGSINEEVTLNSGGIATYSITATVSVDATATINNSAEVTLPEDVVQDPDNNDPDEDDVDITPQQQTASILLDKQLYQGHDTGAQCETVAAVDELTVVDPDQNPIDTTYCFKVTNNGNTYLNDIRLDDAQLSIDETDLTLLPALSDSLPLAPGEMQVFYYEVVLTSSLDNSATTTANPVTPGGTDTGQPDVTSTDNNALLIYVFDPPFGLKTGEVTDAGEAIVNWNMVWINDSAYTASGVIITDEVPEGMTYAGNLICTAEGSSVVSSCDFEPVSVAYPRGRVVVNADIASDPGGTDQDDSDNEVVISFDVTIDQPDQEDAEFENQGELEWDADEDGNPDFTAITDDPTTTEGGDPAVITIAQLSDTGSPVATAVAAGTFTAVAAVGVHRRTKGNRRSHHKLAKR